MPSSLLSARIKLLLEVAPCIRQVAETSLGQIPQSLWIRNDREYEVVSNHKCIIPMCQ